MRVAAALEHDVFQLRQLLADFQHFELNLRRGADRRRRAVELVRIGAGERDEFLHRFRRQVGLDHEGIGRGGQFANPHEVLGRVIGDLVVERGVDRIGVGRQQDGVAVRVRARDGTHADIAAGAADVLDDEGLAGRLLKRSRRRCGRQCRTVRPACWPPRSSPGGPDRRHRPSGCSGSPAPRRRLPARRRP